MDELLAILRPRDRLAESAREARALGFEPIAAPMLEVAPVEPGSLDPLLAGLRARSLAWVAFSSDRAVQAAWALAPDLGRLARSARAVAIGPATRRALEARGVAAEMPEAHDSAGLVAFFRERGVRGQRVALVRSDRGSAELADGLRALGAEVVDLASYRLALPRDLEEAQVLVRRAAEVRAWAFTSTLTVEHLLLVARASGGEAALREALARSVVGAVGKPTAATLERHGIRCDVIAEEARFDALLRGLKQALEAP